MLLLVIVLLGGTEVRINPREIVSIIQAREDSDPSKLYAKGVRCLITTSSNQEFTTKEECSSIEARLRALFEERMRTIKSHQ